MKLSTWIGILVALILLVALPVYIVSILGYSLARTVELRTEQREERYITTVHANISLPTSYAGVKVDVAYYYAKSVRRLRAVVTLPEGYAVSQAEDLPDTNFVRVENVLPAWASHNNPLSESTYGSFSIFEAGFYAAYGTGANDTLTLLSLQNIPAFGGVLAISPATASFMGNALFLSTESCGVSFTDTQCLDYFIGELAVVFSPTGVDKPAWDKQYDAKN